jgi:hypothetical protein
MMEFSDIKTKMGKRRARKKGHEFERWCAIKLRKVFPNAKRHLEFQKSEAKGIDLDHTGQYKIQCKRMKKYAPITCIEEVQCHDWLGEIPVLITAADDRPALAVIPLHELIRLIERDLDA